MLSGILTLIVDAVSGVLGGVLLLRFWVQVVRVRPPNSVGQFTYQLSDWLVKPLRRVIPGVAGYDWASLIGALLVIALATSLKLGLWGITAPEVMVVQSVLRLIQWSLYGLSALIVLEVVFSWINPYAPLAPFVRALNEPVLSPLRRIIPLVGHVDFSSFVALILLQIGLWVVNGNLIAI